MHATLRAEVSIKCRHGTFTERGTPCGRNADIATMLHHENMPI